VKVNLMRPFDSVILSQDLPEYGIQAGTQGVIVDTYAHTNQVFMVEFFDQQGNTLDVVDVRADQMRVTLADFAQGESIALLDDLHIHKLMRGQVGVVKRRIEVGVYEVEFRDTNGNPYAQLTLHAHQMLLLHWQPVAERRSA
jgi:hypothetical protein